MTLWTDIVTPDDLTGYARKSLAKMEAEKGSLAPWLPNREVDDIVVRFVAGQAGLVPMAKFRAYDANPEIGKRKGGKRQVLELNALGMEIPISEYDQLRARKASDDRILEEIDNTVDLLVMGIADRINALRGEVLATGAATIAELGISDSFGRRASHTITLPNAQKWTDNAVSRLDHLRAWLDTYSDTNGVLPGTLLMVRSAYRKLAAGDEFKTNLIGGGSRPANLEEVNSILIDNELPPVTLYDRKTEAGPVLPANMVLMLPEAVDPNNYQGTELGGTFWGQTLTSQDSEYKLAASEQPGIVVGAYKNPKPPMHASVISDAIALPVLANADLSLAATVA